RVLFRSRPAGADVAGGGSACRSATRAATDGPCRPRAASAPYPSGMADHAAHAQKPHDTGVAGAPQALVFGASGQIGRALLGRLSDAGWAVLALSRQAQPALAGVRWQAGELAATGPLPRSVDAIFSCGPLDGFAQWFARAAPDCPRVIAFGSTSVEVKRDSADAAERDVAARLRAAEDQLFA